MKKKAVLLGILGAVVLAVAAVGTWFGLRVAPTVDHAVRISSLLQRVLDEENQSMNLAAAVTLDGQTLEFQSRVLRIQEDGLEYLVIERDGNAVYVAENVLYLENGKAFKIGDELSAHTVPLTQLLPQIRTIFEAMEITAQTREERTDYCVTVTGGQMQTLLQAVSMGEILPVEGIETLQLCLTEQAGELEEITISGSGTQEGTEVSLDVTISGFRILAAGGYPIPEPVKESAATVDPDALFSLSEDLYRLALAMVPLLDMEEVAGQLTLMIDCGLLQLDTRVDLADLNAGSGSQLDPEKLQALPEILSLLCMEGEISCTREEDRYLYLLELDPASMKELAGMILPGLSDYAEHLSKGTASIVLRQGRVSAMTVSIAGSIDALITRIPISVGVQFDFE